MWIITKAIISWTLNFGRCKHADIYILDNQLDHYGDHFILLFPVGETAGENGFPKSCGRSKGYDA